jgi:hypothetical protein
MLTISVKFGEPLAQIPEFIHRAFQYLEEYGLEEEGLFRLPGSTTEVHYNFLTNHQINQLKDMLENGSTIDMSACKYIHSVCSLIKLYIRELPVPLCTYDCYDMFLACATVPVPDLKKELLRKVLKYIPVNNFEYVN